MKRCPECGRDYNDDSLSFCLDDGENLVFGPGSGDEPPTAVLHETNPPSEARTRTQIHLKEEDAAYPTTEPSKAKGFDKRLFLTVLVIAMTVTGGFLAYRYFVAPVSGQINSIAVLPFENGSEDPEMDYLSDGLSESLIDKLSQLAQLKVTPRSSSFRFRGPDIDLQEVSKKLGVEAVITGRLIKRGDRLNVRVELIDTTDNKQLWSEQFNRNVSDALSIEQEIALVVAEKLRSRISGEEESEFAKSGTGNPRAYELMLKGRYLVNLATTEGNRKGQEFLEQAVAADPQYALATALLANTYRLNAQEGYVPEMTFERAEAAARRALELEPGLPEAHYALAAIFRATWRYREAEAEYNKAMSSNPNLAGPRGSYATLLSFMGRHDEAIAEATRALELDPLSPVIWDIYCRQFAFARRYDDLIVAANKWAELDRNNAWVNGWLGDAFESKGDYDRAIAEHQAALSKDAESERASWEASIAMLYAKKGERERANQILAKLKGVNHRPQHRALRRISALYILLGDNNTAFELLENARAARAAWLNEVLVSPDYDPIREDPKFKDLLKRMGVLEFA